MTEESTCHTGSTMLAFAIGAVVGAGAALLLAPCSGRETRELIARRGRELKERAQGALEGAHQAVREKKQDVMAAVEAGKQAMREQRATT